MTKREEIREGLIKFFTPPNTTFKGNPILEENITQVVESLMVKLDDLGVVIKVDRELPVVCELEPDVDACFGQEVCCEILPKYLPSAGSVSDECYREIIGLAYALADTIAKTQRDFNAKAGYVAVKPLIKE